MRTIPALLGLALSAVAVAAAARQDTWAAKLLERLKSHAAFSKLAFVERADLDPLTFMVQKPDPKTSRGFEVEMVNSRAPWIAQIAANVRSEYTDRMGLQRRAGVPGPSLVLLWTLQDYQNYLKVAPDPNTFSESAHFDSTLGAVVSFEWGAPTLAPQWKRFPELTQFVRGELEAFKTSADVRLPFLIVEGLGAYMASHRGGDPSSLLEHVIDKRSVEKVVRTAHDAGQRNATLLSLAASLDAATYEEHRAALIRRAGPAAEKLIAPKDMLETVQAQAWTLIFFLHQAESGRFREPFQAYLKSALQGQSGTSAFQRAFEDVSLPSLEEAYYKWVFEQFNVLVPNAKVDPAAIKGLLSARAAPTSASGVSAAAFDPTSLALSAEEVTERHAAVVHAIRAGRIDAAIQELEEMRLAPNLGEEAGHIEREILRCRTFVMLRNKHLADLAADGGRFAFEQDGKKVNAKVRSVADGFLYLEENRAGVEKLEIAALDPYALAKEFSKSVSDGSGGWARWYPYVLAGDAKGARSLKGSDEASALKEDAKDFYPRMLEVGEGIVGLRLIADAGEPQDAASAEICLDRIKGLREKHGKLPAIEKRSAALQQFARIALKKLWGIDHVGEATSAKVESLPDGRVRLTYGFDKQDEGADFQADHEYFASWRTSLGPLNTKAPKFAVEGGVLALQGAACVRHAWTFEAPVSVKYEVGFQGWNPAVSGSAIFAVGALDDRAESFVWSQGFGSVFANYLPTKFVKQDSLREGKEIEDGARYSLELEIAKRKASTRENGQPVKQIDDVPNDRGAVFLYVHSDPLVVFEKLVIEGKPDLAGIEEAWKARKLAELGF